MKTLDKKIKFDVNTESLEVQDDDGKKKKRRKKKDKNDDKLRYIISRCSPQIFPGVTFL